MKLFKHYKNKAYTLVGEAKHSETLEDLVLYETRYENPLGKLWARPKSMFFESLDVNGIPRPRFQEIPLKIKATTQIREVELESIAQVMKLAFGEWDARWFHATFKNHAKFFLLLADVEDQVVAFKMGYELTANEFYSWLGGVIPEYRNLEIASDLMEAQHRWCAENGYKKVQTKTQNRFRNMLLLNLRSGFEIVGFHDSDDGGPKIVLEKKL